MNQLIKNEKEVIVKKSTFITYTYEFNDKTTLNSLLTTIKVKHPQARHVVYAYVLNKDTFKYSDDGEPKHTAGKPLYNILHKNNIIYSLVIVVRYFGGIKLGANGLIRSYPQGVKSLIEEQQFQEYKELHWYKTTISIQNYNKFIKMIAKYKHQTTFQDISVELIFNITTSEYESLNTSFTLTKV